METAEVLIHRLMVRRTWMPVALERLRAHGIDAQATCYDLFTDKYALDWVGPLVELDFLRPDILPAIEERRNGANTNS